MFTVRSQRCKGATGWKDFKECCHGSSSRTRNHETQACETQEQDGKKLFLLCDFKWIFNEFYKKFQLFIRAIELCLLTETFEGMYYKN